jgi:hypothetical protein
MPMPQRDNISRRVINTSRGFISNLLQSTNANSLVSSSTCE